jgi:hypothetical protein
MLPGTVTSRGLKTLTDVQLVHHLNDALVRRERQIGISPPSRAARLLRALPFRHPLVYALVTLAEETREAARGAGLAVTLSSGNRLTLWAEGSRARLYGLDADIAILRMLDEMERRMRRRR